MNYIQSASSPVAYFGIEGNVRYWPKAVVQWVLLNVRFRWIADIQNNQLECLFNTESRRLKVAVELWGRDLQRL